MAKPDKNRFIKVKTESGGFTGPATTVLVDRQTGVNYLFACSGYAGGLTPLLNRDGTPVVTPVPSQYDE